MKKLLLVLFSSFLFCSGMSGQCPQEDIILTTQQEIDDFASTYPGCTELLGDVLIGSLNTGTNINNLNGLINITGVSGWLRLLNIASVTTLTGLDNLTTVGGSLSIGSSLTTLAGLENLSTVGGNLNLRFNINLTTLAALANLTTVGGTLEIDHTDLTNLTGLENLSSIGGKLDVSMNQKLTSLEGLESLSTLGGLEIYYNNNNNFTDLSGLEGITSLNSLRIYDNKNLATVVGLENLVTVAGTFQIDRNDNLTTLTDLQNLNSVGAVYITDNPVLALCNAPGICNFLMNGGQATIQNNTSSCVSPLQVLVSCPVTALETPNTLDFSIPNPNMGLFQIQGIVNGTYRIFNTTGQVILSGLLNEGTYIDMPETTSGIYFIEIREEERVGTRRFVKH